MADAVIGSSYLQVIPKMDVSSLNGQSIAAGKSGGNDFGGAFGKAADGKIGSVLKTAGKAFAALGIGKAVTDFGKAAFDSYANYEQLVGGVDKLFGDASGKLQEYASQAYKTSGMSANQYMEQATSFSASLIQSLGGDTQKAADIADVAMRAMSDNVNTFGSDMGSVQYAFQGFAKQNYTMLDNLKLGYGGTKEEMQRLIEDANAYAEANGKAADLSMDSFADIVQAIELIQEKQGIAGTTAKEASSTLEGSINQAKAAWENALTSFGQGPEQIREAFGNLFDSLVTLGENVGEYVLNATVNTFDAIMNAIGMTDEQIAEVHAIFEQLGQTMMENVAPYVEQLVASFGSLAETCTPFTSQVGPFLMTVFKGIAELASALVGAIALLASMFLNSANNVIKAAGDMWTKAGQAIDGLNGAVAGAWQAIKDATSSAWDAIQAIPEEAADAIRNAVDSALGAVRSTFTTVWNAAKSTVSHAANGIRSAITGISSVVGKVRSTFDSIKAAMTKPIEDAKATVKGILDKVKGFFPLSIGKVFTNLSLPKISVNGGSPPFGIGGKGSLPSFDVTWGKLGGFLDNPTLIGAGEAGPELLLPESGRLMDRFSSAVASKVGGNTVNVYLQYDASADATQMAYEIANVLNRRLAMEG